MSLRQVCKIGGLRELAVRGQRHVGLDHHNKVAMADCEAHVGNLAALRGATAIVTNARWCFTLARLKPETAQDFGIPDTERKAYRRLDSLKASYGADDDTARLLHVESVTIAKGESVGVLVEVDMERTRQEAGERKREAEDDKRQRLTDALAEMRRQARPRSASAQLSGSPQTAPSWCQARGANRPPSSRCVVASPPSSVQASTRPSTGSRLAS